MYSKVHVSPCRLDGFPVDCNQDKDHSHKDPRILGLVENLVLCGDSASRPFFTFPSLPCTPSIPLNGKNCDWPSTLGFIGGSLELA